MTRSKLLYAPPVLASGYKTLTLHTDGSQSCTGGVTTDSTGGWHFNYDDVLVVYPTTGPYPGEVHLRYVHNVVCIGGVHISNYGDNGGHGVFNIEDATGCIHIEGLWINQSGVDNGFGSPNGANPQQHDGFWGACWSANQTCCWVWQNVYSNGARDNHYYAHGDFFQSCSFMNKDDNSGGAPNNNVSIGPCYCAYCTIVTNQHGFYYDNGNGGYAFVNNKGPYYFTHVDIHPGNQLISTAGSGGGGTGNIWSDYEAWQGAGTSAGPISYFGPVCFCENTSARNDVGSNNYFGGNNTADLDAVGSSVGTGNGSGWTFNPNYAFAQPWNPPGLGSNVTSAKISSWGGGDTGDGVQNCNGTPSAGHAYGDWNNGQDCGLNYPQPGTAGHPGYLNSCPFTSQGGGGGGGGTTPPPPPPTARGSLLAYTPPTLSNPMVINLASGGGGTLASGGNVPTNAAGKWTGNGGDVSIVFPSNNTVAYSGPMIYIQDVNNLVIIGGHMTCTQNFGAQGAAIEVENATGTVYIEGLWIDPGNGGQYEQDAFRGVCFTAGKTCQWVFQNVFTYWVVGSDSANNPTATPVHGEMYLPYGYYQGTSGQGGSVTSNVSVGAMKYDFCTCWTTYQGIFADNGNSGFPYIAINGPVYISNMNFRFKDNTNPHSYFIWGNDPGGSAGPVFNIGTNVYLDPSGHNNPQQSLNTEVWMGSPSEPTLSAGGTGNPDQQGSNSTGALDANGNLVMNSSYQFCRPYNRPNSSDNVTTATFWKGLPPGLPYQDFCPAPDGGDWSKGRDMCGLNYVSPGYLGVNNPPPATAPTASNATFTMTENTTLTGSLSTSAVDPNNSALTWHLSSNPAHGTVSLDTAGNFTYTPTTNYTGTDSFQWYVTNASSAQSNTATASITINASVSGDVPVANAATFSMLSNTTLTSSLSSYATDPGGAALTFSLSSQATSGTASVAGSGSFTYVPNNNYTGSDAFVYGVTNGTNSATAHVTITISASINPPTVSPSAPNLQVTILNAQQGDTAVINNVTNISFYVQVINGGVGVQRNINWVAQGY